MQASAAARDDKVTVLAAVALNGLAVQFASPRLRKDYDVALAAVGQTWQAFGLLPHECRGDRALALVAVTQGAPEACALLPHTLRSDKDVVLAALVDGGPLALQHASKALRGDKAVVLCAVRRDGRALAFASSQLRADDAVCTAAVRENRNARAFCSKKCVRRAACNFVLTLSGHFWACVLFPKSSRWRTPGLKRMLIHSPPL